jgi:predicted permease
MNGWIARTALRLLPRAYRARFGDDLCREWRTLSAATRREQGRLAEWRYLARETQSFARLVRETRAAERTAAPRWPAWRVDGRAAWRRMRQHPGRLLGASLMLAAALTATLVAFAVADAVLWRDLPFADSDRLVAVWERTGSVEAGGPARITGSRFVDWAARATTFEDLAAFGAAGFLVEGGEGVTTVRGVRASGHFFDVLGVRPVAGRLFTRADQEPGAPRVVVLSYGYWLSRYAGRMSVIDESVVLSGQTYTIIGVLPDIWLPAWPVNPAIIQLDREHRQLWVPMPPVPSLAQNAGSHLFGAIGRLAPGQTPESATQQLVLLASADQPDPHGGVVRPLRGQMVQQARAPLLLLLCAACCVLLVACLNLAAIDLAAFESRLEEFRVRAALGAGSIALARQLLFESFPVVAVSSVVALALSQIVLTSAAAQLGTHVPLLTAPQLDLSAVWLLAALAAVTILAMTVWPVRAVRALGHLHDHSDRRVTRSNPAVFRALIVGQLTGAVALVVISTVLVRSFLEVGARDPGFDPTNVHVLEISLPRDRYLDPLSIVAVERLLRDRVAGSPGVAAATMSHDHPFEANWLAVVTVVGGASAGETRGDARAQVQLRIVEPGYVEAMRARLIDGRSFEPGIEPTDAGQVLVNEAFVRREGVGLGQQLTLSSPRGTWGDAVPGVFSIVGILGDERFRGLDVETEPAVYVTTRQFPQSDLSLLVRYAPGRTVSGADLRAIVRNVAPRASLGTLRPLVAIEAARRAPRTLMTTLITAFASGTLVLAATGLYGMLMLLLTARQREIGIRIALGATPQAVTRETAWQALVPIVVGTVLGLGLAVVGERTLRAVFTETTTAAPVTLVVVVAVMALVGVAAALVPVRRARRISPAELLRS